MSGTAEILHRADAGRQGDVDLAEDAADHVDADRSYEPRTPLWRDQGKLQQACELLAPVYGWFTEGFETRDLKEAKALLEELA